MAIELKTYNDILGALVRKIIADTSINDLNRGSVLLTLLEAVAAQDFDNNVAILSVLETLSIDAIRNSDLDQRAADYGITRIPASKATGFVKIGDSSINKRSTTLYAVKPAPIAGSTVIYVNDASTWNTEGGQLFIGRGTLQFEGPVTYTSIVQNGSFYAITLASSLQKDHLISDSVIDAQDKVDRIITAGTSIVIPANNVRPETVYLTLRDAVLAAGEDSIENIPIVAEKVGTASNTGIDTIIKYVSPPFQSATVSNTSALIDGRDAETDTQLRERVKNYTTTLARGTRASILSSIIGVSDSDDGKQIASAMITEPPVIGDPAIIYIDDGTGFQPSYKGQAIDILLNFANGDEEFLQLANYPLPRPQIINQVEGPVELKDKMVLSVLVDGVLDEVTFKTSQFINITSATFSEIVVAINENASLFKCRLTDNSSRLLLYPTSHTIEKIQVQGLTIGEDSTFYANSILKFPTVEYSYISLYRNNEKLNEKAKFAFTISNVFSSWGITESGNLIIEVDGTPPQDRSFSSVDFGGKPLAAVTLPEWTEVFTKKFAGISVSATASDKLLINSNKVGSESLLNIVGGTYFNQMFGGLDVSSQGQDSNFSLNRQTGNIRLNFKLNKGDTVTAGTTDTKGNSISSETTTGYFNMSLDTSQRDAEIILTTDGKDVVPRLTASPVPGNSIRVEKLDDKTMRLIVNVSTIFDSAQIDDFIYIPYKIGSSTWFSQNNTGLFKIKAKGSHVINDVDTYVDVINVGASEQGPFVFVDSVDLQVFKSDTYPQIWKGSYLSVPYSASLQDIIVSMKSHLQNVLPTIYRTNSLKLTSTSENDGSICIPVSSGRASVIFETQQNNKFGNVSHIAAKQISKDLISIFKRTTPYTNNVFLNRYVYSSIKDTLDSNTEPQTSTFNEEIQALGTFNENTVNHDDFVSFTSGSNKGHFRSIKEFIANDSLRTQLDTPKTIMDHAQGDQVDIIEPLSISPTDSVVFVLDGDPITKTININMWRSGRVNGLFPSSASSFSADDTDNEAGKTFSDLQVWSKELTGAEFKDYGVTFRSRNWYRTGGALSSGATLLVRAKEYGINGDKHQFRMEYPTLPNQVAKVSHVNLPEKTLTTCTFASGAGRVTGIVGGTSFKVTDLGSYNYRYTFQEAGVDLSSVSPGDIISLSDSSGVTEANRGTFYIQNKDTGNRTIDIYNPNGETTDLGLPEISEVVCIADIVGTPMVQTITCTAEGSGTNLIGTGDYFILNDDIGGVGFWYAVNNPPLPPIPVVPGVYRMVKISTVITGDDATDVAIATTAVINSDPKFSAVSTLNEITVTNEFNGDVSVGVAGPSTGFIITKTIPGTSNNSIGGKYFKLYDKDGSVGVWFNVGSLEPFHGCLRSIQVVIPAGSNAETVASLVATALNNDSEFTVSVSGSTVTVTDAHNGVRVNISSNTSGFTVSTIQNGIDPEVERINFTSGCNIFPLESNDAQSIADKISTSQTLTAVPVGDSGLMFTKATREEIYTYSGNNSALAYGHNPDPLSGLNGSIHLYDGESYVKIFANSHPNFVLKKPLLLNGIVPSIYTMNSCPNQESTDLGEFFKLVPKTVNNVKHHFSHKALSQLSIIADIDVSSNFRRVQVKSKKLGTSGSVEVVGGRANIGEFSIIGDAQVTPYEGSDYAEVKISAFPMTINNGDVVRVYNNFPAKRLSRFLQSDTVDVYQGLDQNFEYRLNSKKIYSTPYTKWTITDASSYYGVSSGTVWRWCHSSSGANVEIQSLSNSTVPAPVDYTGSSTPNAINLHAFNHINGLGANKSSFSLTVSDIPSQGDYFFFEMTLPDAVSFAVWFGIDGNTSLPTGSPFSSAANKIMVPILSTDTPSAITVKLWNQLTANSMFTSLFSSTVSNETNLNEAKPGDTLFASGIDVSIWPINNQARLSGDGKFAGFPVVNVDVINQYVDVVNPFGVEIATPTLPVGSSIKITPSYGHQWRLKHNAMTSILSITVSSGVNCFVTTTNEHNFTVGTHVDISEAGNTNLNGTVVITSVPSVNTFTFTLSTPISNSTYVGGRILKTGTVETRYKLEKLGFNGLSRLVRTDGSSPFFVDCGAAVDDFVVISGSTFKTVNNGRYRILAVDNDSLIIKSDSILEEINSYKLFNELNKTVTWTSNSSFITGSTEAFKNVTVGSWVKKRADRNELFVQVLSIDQSSPTEVTVTLGSAYKGIVSNSEGVVFNQVNDINMGVYLKNTDDIKIYEGDSVVVNDNIVIENNSISGWFNTANSGVFPISAHGTSTDNRPFVRVKNPKGIGESDRKLFSNVGGFYLMESTDNLYESYRVINHAAINQFNVQQRTIYLTPATCDYKMSQSYGTKIESQGKLGFEVSISTGIDGYTYYTGLMRTVQRIIDGYEPDPANYPGKRAVGSSIELLPPLLKNISITINITTHEGVNLTDISNDIKSTIIGYVNTLGVGEDVILSEIIARIMGLNGIQAATFTSPSASTERITVTDDQKALITPEQISLS